MWGSRGLAPLIFSLDPKWKVTDQHHAPASSAPGKYPVAHLKGGWVGPRTGLDVLGRRKKKVFHLQGFEHRIVHYVAESLPTEPSRTPKVRAAVCKTAA